MKKKTGLLIVSAFLLVFLLSCEENTDPPGTSDEITLEITTVANGYPVGGVTLSYDGSSVVTGADGKYSISIAPDETSGDLPATVTVEASKKFFVTTTSVFTTADYASRAAYSEVIEIDPRIFLVDKMGNTGKGRVVAIDDMNGTNRVDLYEIPGYLESGAEDDENADELGLLDCPTAITVDYENGIIYIFDIQTDGTPGYSYNYSWLIRLTDFPESAGSSLSASDVEIFELAYSDGGDGMIYTEAVHQAIVTGADEVILVSGYVYDPPVVLRLSGMSTGTISIEEPENGFSGVWTNGTGLAALPGGELLVLVDRMNADDDFYVFDGWSSAPALWSELAYSDPGWEDADYFALAYRTLIDRTGRWLFVGDIYNSDWFYGDAPGPEADRIARFDLESSSSNLDRDNFGSPGSGENQFDEPVLLAVLPDNRLYIKDTGNQRLVRMDLTGSSIADWESYKPADNLATTVDESFGFDFFYNGC